MSSNMKLAAERLFKLADAIEEEAYNSTYFVCDDCNHTASLKDINERRKQAAEKNNVLHIAKVTVNDNITCVACGGKMAYVPTNSSMKYYVEAEGDEDEDDEENLDIFEPVDESGEKDKEETPGNETPPDDIPSEEPSQETPEEEKIPPVDDESEMKEDITEDNNIPSTEEEKTEDILPESDEEKSDIVPPMEETSPEEEKEDITPPEEDSDIIPPGDTDEPVMEETVEEDVMEEKPKKKKKNRDIDFPQKETPKFEKIPKDANDAFWLSVKKYSI